MDDLRLSAASVDGLAVHTNEQTQPVVDLAGGSHACVLIRPQKIFHKLAQAVGGGTVLPVSGRAFATAPQLELADYIARFWEDEDTRVHLTSTGTEGIETAVRLAYHVQELRGRSSAHIVIGRRYSYHGMSLLARNIGDHPRHSPSGAQSFGWPKLAEPRCDACPLHLSFPECHLACADELNDILDSIGDANVAAVVIEPIAGTTGGALVPPSGYLQRVKDICLARGILLIIDEVVTAFWRTGSVFATPDGVADLVVGGKTLAAGLAPLGCVIVSGDLTRELRVSGSPIPLRSTFSGNPLACLVGLLAQQHIEASGLPQRINKNDTYIRRYLAKRCAELPEIGFSGIGHLWALNALASQRRPVDVYGELTDVARAKGASVMGGVVGTTRGEQLHLMVAPPFDATHQELEHMLDLSFEIMESTLEQLRSTSY